MIIFCFICIFLYILYIIYYFVLHIFLQQVVLPRRYRSMVPTAQHITEYEEGVENLLTKECLHSYTSNWNLVHYKYAAYSGTYLELPRYVNL